jgi:8-oxo-dGTP pyrophosphatase MutT (NUDIX family)
MKIETLKDNKWLSLKNMVDPGNGVNGYVFSHETRCDGKIVSILPYRKVGDKIEFCLRKEVTPCWSMEQQISSITGGVENNDPVTTAIHEIEEEAGYKVTKNELVSLGTCFGTKSSDTVYHLFTVDLTDKEKGIASGDGSELEAKAECYWDKTVEKAVDPFVYTNHYKLMKLLGKFYV